MRVTEREGEILAMIANGLCDKEIAGRLDLRVRTVRTHVERLFLRNGLHSRAAAVSAWIRDRKEMAATQGSETDAANTF